jgi:hypothetical protein
VVRLVKVNQGIVTVSYLPGDLYNRKLYFRLIRDESQAVIMSGLIPLTGEQPPIRISFTFDLHLFGIDRLIKDPERYRLEIGIILDKTRRFVVYRTQTLSVEELEAAKETLPSNWSQGFEHRYAAEQYAAFQDYEQGKLPLMFSIHVTMSFCLCLYHNIHLFMVMTNHLYVWVNAFVFISFSMLIVQYLRLYAIGLDFAE